MTRDDIKKESLNLAQIYNILALEWATGIGKTKVALDISNSIITTIDEILIVVAELAHIQNWKDEFIKWGYKDLLEKVTIVTYASLKKHKDKSYKIIILDEGHHIGSDLRMDIIDNIKFKKLLILSATLNNDLISNLELTFKQKIHRFTITLQEAIDWKLLKEPCIYLIPLSLRNDTQSQTIIEEWGKEKLRVNYKTTYIGRWTYLKNKDKYPNVRLEISCTELEKYLYLNEKFEYFKKLYFRNRNEAIKNKWLQMGNKRKKYLGELKTKIVKDFIDKNLKDSRYLCFCTSIEQANILGKENAIHSEKKDSLNIINAFNNKNISNLYAVGMLQEGQNLIDIDAGVIIQLDGQERSFVQKFGRTMRADNPIQYIFYYKYTRDEEYLNNNVINGIDPKFIKEMKYKIE